MVEMDPGHLFRLDALDGADKVWLRFVKRQGDKYPGNHTSYSGTTTQEVLRAVVARLRYVYSQAPCVETAGAIDHAEKALVALERRAARLHGRLEEFRSISEADVVRGTGKCARCGHVGCTGSCGR